MKGIDFTGLAYLAGFGLVIYFAWQVWQKTPAIAKAAADKLNPASPTNIFYTTVNSATRAISGDPATTFGAKAYDVMNQDTNALIAQLSAPVAPAVSEGAGLYADQIAFAEMGNSAPAAMTGILGVSPSSMF